MKFKFNRYLSLLLILSSIVITLISPTDSRANSSIPDIPVKGMVTMVDLGAKKCIPCKMMAPILAKLEKAYAGKAAIVFIDVWENKEAGQKFGISAIPTQIFFDADGKEITRHTGFFSEEEIVAQLAKMGVKI